VIPNILALGVGFFVLPLIVGGGLLFNGMRNDHRLANRFAALHRSGGASGASTTDAMPNESILKIAVRAISVVGDGVIRLGLLSGRTRDDVETTLRSAGYSGTGSLRLFVGAKILLLVSLPVAAWFGTEEYGAAFSTQIITVAAAAICGLLAPDKIVGNLRASHMKRIQDELPDALDMMVICAQAGLGLGTTIIRVAQELQDSHRAVALELAHTANELQMMTDGKQPLINLGNRCGVESARRLATTLLQSAQYGTPLTEALRGLAGELRTELITRFEAKAARMPVLLTLPMVGFILPSVFLVIGGPAVIQVMHALAD
jgi:tight adherence protein C